MSVGPPAIDARLSLDVGEGPGAFHLEAELALDDGILVLFGPSGAGKSLTLLALAGLVPASGHVRVHDETLLDTVRGVSLPTHRRRIGYVPQSQTLFPFLDVLGNVGFGLPARDRQGARAESWLTDLGIAHLRHVRPESLSGGERQRVALARALAVEPHLLLLDEPFASIDEEGTAALRELVRRLVRQYRIPTVLVTHDRDEALDLGDRLVRFARGKTTVSGTPREILKARA